MLKEIAVFIAGMIVGYLIGIILDSIFSEKVENGKSN